MLLCHLQEKRLRPTVQPLSIISQPSTQPSKHIRHIHLQIRNHTYAMTKETKKGGWETSRLHFFITIATIKHSSPLVR